MFHFFRACYLTCVIIPVSLKELLKASARGRHFARISFCRIIISLVYIRLHELTATAVGKSSSKSALTFDYSRRQRDAILRCDS